ncbi:DUF4388 domain-containing protein [Oscillatoria sp. CS-180]|uniref:DUF4388 domain-containing protein n=1 Tax=Oscillatoria sp. CS-180 TaxID=3021720 RepID=UPI00232F9028|nr:DUF4388 domain-containing protein [Oscillatoria sp. CS-180]MDB9524919.1 DUF4388 domain-containing protein [Oscillatoria sp. CS-180]
MAITGHLAEFSLAEIFQFLEQGHKTGLLSITPLPEPSDQQSARSHYVWFQQGRVIAAANRSDGRGLLSLISQRGWLGDRAASRLVKNCDVSTAAGLYFKSQGLLQADQLKMLFYVQVMQQVCALFTLEDGWFHFDTSRKAPFSELTGLSAPAVDVTLSGLRALKNWSALEDKLPDPDSGLTSMIEGKPMVKLKQMEWQVWEFADGQTTLAKIAQHLQCPVKKVQQVAFRLIVVSLVEEMPLLGSMPEPELSYSISPQDVGGQGAEPINHSFLDNLVGFLKRQV